MKTMRMMVGVVLGAVILAGINFGLRAQSNGMFLKTGFDYQGMTNGAVCFVIHLPVGSTNGFNLYMTTNLTAKAPGLNLTNWLWLGRSAPGQTNWNISATNTCVFYRLWTTNNTAGGGTPTVAILSQPLDQDVTAGDTVTFSVVATGNGPLSYQWTCNGTNIAGATTNSYTIDNVQSTDAASYTVTVSCGSNSIPSRDAQLTVESGTGDPWLMTLQGQRQNYSLKSGVTYYISSTVGLFGTTTLKGGTVVKFDYNYPDSSLAVYGNLICDTQPYYPAILTSVDDDSVGEAIGSGNAPVTAANGVAYLNLDAATNASISNLRICYADEGVTTPTASRQLDVWDCQFLECNFAIVNLVPGFGALDRLHNVLFSYCGAAIGAVSNSVEVEAEQVTADVATFWLAGTPPYKLALTNSIILGELDAATLNWTQHVVVAASNSIYQTVNAGGYYLPTGSPYHQAGTTNISQRLRSEFAAKTTYPPVVFPAIYTLTGDLTLFPQATRDTGGAPDLGYHYDALDYTVADLILNGATLTIEPGTAIGCRMEYVSDYQSWNYVGIDVWENSGVISRGTPNKPNVFTDVQLVQEQFEWPVWAEFVPDFFPTDASSQPPALDFRFSNFYLTQVSYMGTPAHHFFSGVDLYTGYEWSLNSVMNFTLQDCKLQGGQINLGTPDYSYFDPGQYWGAGSITWRNNSFDRVNLNLDPTFYWYNSVVNCDMQLQANNNLFRGGDWFLLEPIPATAGNWVFEDNLFDKVDFLQDTNSPLDFDYNGYWPKLAAELLWGGDAGQLQPTVSTNLFGIHEPVLSNAPPYQAGPLGNFYLPNTTALYGAGSTNAGALGLAHYTTSTNQTKEGATHRVNIGLHYVATASAISIMPKDSDGDGIPDYVENWHGDGNYSLHTDSETDWQNPVTDGMTYDFYNAVYDDIDLSGDGLVGRVKRALRKNPLDPSNPFTLKQVITGVEPDIATFEVPVSYNTLTNIGKLQLLVDGHSVSFQESDPATNGHCLLTWNTTFNSPGQHYIQTKLTLNGQLHMGDTPDPTILTGVGLVSSFYSSNVCQFNPFYSEYDTNHGAILYATTPACPNADYSIEIQTLAGSHIKTITNSTSSGVISEHWDLTDDNGNPITNDAVKAVFNVTLLDPATGTNALYMYSMNELYNGSDGGFTVAYAWDKDNEASGDLRDCIQLSVVDPLIGTCNATCCFLDPQTGLDLAYHSTFNTWSDFGTLQGNPGYLSNNSDVTRLLNNLSNTNPLAEPTLNFFFFGHGNQSAIGDGDRKQVNIDSSQVASKLGNYAYSIGPTNKIRLRGWAYRFVFLDACATANDDTWASSFGVFDRLTTTDLANWPEKVQAFVGWNGLPKVPSSGNLMDMSDAFTVFFSAWQSGLPLDDCIYYASQENPPAPLDGFHLNWNFGPSSQHYNSLQQWWFGVDQDPRLKIYGYAGITRTGYQPGHDQSPYYK